MKNSINFVNKKQYMESTENTFGIRLKLARKMAGMSLQDLADNIGNKVTKQALSKYETGAMKPSGEVVILLSKALKVNPDYFFKHIQVKLGEVEFRKRASLSKCSEEIAIERARDFLERVGEIENILGIVRRFENPVNNLRIENKNHAELASLKLREVWELGNSPVSNIIEMLEIKGVQVVTLDEVEEVDGFSSYTLDGVPVVVVNVSNKSVERLRFTIIHELAHLLLNFAGNVKNDVNLVEKLCHYFSSCFLIPSKMLVKMVGGSFRTYIRINELIKIKEYYGISIRALLHRLEELNLITPLYYKKWMVYLSKEFGSKDEPGNYKGDEKATLLELYVNRALAEGLISVSKAASLSNTTIDNIRRGFVGAN